MSPAVERCAFVAHGSGGTWRCPEPCTVDSQWCAAHAGTYEPLRRSNVVPEDAPPVPTIEVAASPADGTGLWNADLLIQLYGSKLRYVPQLKKGTAWYAASENLWRPKEEQVYVYAREVLIALFRHHPDMKSWARRSMDYKHINEMVRLAEKDPRVIAHPTDFDKDTNLFNVENGVLDLRTCALRDRSEEDMLSKLAPVQFEPHARSDVWSRFLERVQPNPKMQVFLQKIVGSALHGRQRDERFYYHQGPEATGKSTFLEAVSAAFGEYAGVISANSLLKSRNDSVPADLAGFVGKRLVTGSEPTEGRGWDAALIKRLVGNDEIAARFFYGQWFSYVPGFVLMISGNDRPAVSASDGGFWRRCVLVPWEQQIPVDERDGNMKELFRTSKEVRAAILAWAVRGYELWKDDRTLMVPSTVIEATAKYRRENEPLHEWGEDRLNFGPQYETSGSELRESYDLYCAGNQLDPKKVVAKGKAWGKALRGLGLAPVVDEQGNEVRARASQIWRGARVKPLGGVRGGRAA